MLGSCLKGIGSRKGSCIGSGAPRGEAGERCAGGESWAGGAGERCAGGAGGEALTHAGDSSMAASVDAPA